MQRFTLSSVLAMTALIVMTGCGRGSSLNQSTLPVGTESGLATSPTNAAISYPAPQMAGTTQSPPGPGAKAVATPNGYVYEQNPSTTDAAYNFYNAQNPCLFSKAGQRAACNGQSSYYAQPGANMTGNPTTGYPNTQSSYPGGAYPTNTATVSGAYGQSYPQTSSYGQAYPQSSYAQNTTYPSSYGSATGTYAASNPYGTATSAYNRASVPVAQSVARPAAVQPVAQPVTSTPVQQQSVPQATSQSQADKAQSRIAPEGSSTSSGGGSKKVTF